MSKDYGRLDFGSAKKDFIEELRKAKTELNSESDGMTEVIGDNWDDGVEYSVRKIHASSIKLSNAFKNLRTSLNKQVQTLTSEYRDKKFTAKIDFSNIDINSDDFKRKVANIMSDFTDHNIINFDVKGSEQQFQNLISLYTKYEEKLNSLREVQNFSSNDDAIHNLKEQIVLASKMRDIFNFLDNQTDNRLPLSMDDTGLRKVIVQSINGLQHLQKVKEEVSKEQVATGDFKNIEEILRSLKETIEGIKGSLEPISEIFKNEGTAMQTMAANGTSSFNSLSEAVNALYNNLKNVEQTVDAISKKKFDITNITQINQKGGASASEKLSAYQEMANGLLEITKKLNEAQASVGNKNNKLWTDAVASFGGLYKFMTETEKYDPINLSGKISGATTVANIKNVIGQLTSYKNIFLSIVNEINKAKPGSIDTSFLAPLDEFEKKIKELEAAKPIDKNLLKGAEDMSKSMSSGDLASSVEQLEKIADVLTQIKDALDPLSKAFTTGGTLLNQMATSGAITMDTFIEKLQSVVRLSNQLATSPVVHTIIPDEGQVGFDIDSAGEMPDTKDSVDEVSAESQEFKELGQNAKEAAVAKEKFNDANKKVAQGAKESVAGILEEAAAMEELEGSSKGTWTTPREGGSIKGMNLPLQIVGENGQSAVRMFANIKDRLEKQFHSPVQIKFTSEPKENGELAATAATISYVNKELGVTVSQMYDIKENDDGILVATQTLEKAIIGTTKEAKNFDVAMQQALAKERIETFKKKCGSIAIDLTEVSDAAGNIFDAESLKKFELSLKKVDEQLKQKKLDLRSENTLDPIVAAEKKLATLPSQVNVFRKNLAPLLKLEGADKVSKMLDDMMTSYVNFMNKANGSDVRESALKNIIDSLPIVKSMMSELKMDDSMSKFDEASKKQIESYKKIVEYKKKLQSGTLGPEESKLVAEKLKAEQQNYLQITKELKTYGNLYDSESRLKLLAEARLKVLEKINEAQAKADDKVTKQASNYGKSTYNSATRKYDSTLGAFENVDDGVATKEMIAALEAYKQKYDELTAARQKFIDNPALADNQAEKNAFNATAKATEEARKKLQLYIDDMQKLKQVEEDGLLKGETQIFDPSGVDSQTEAIKKYANSLFGGKLQITGWNAAGNEMYGNLDRGKGVIESVTVALDRGTNTLYSYGKGTKELGTVWQQMVSRIGKKAKEITAYIGGGSTIYKAISEVRKGIQYVKELDSALTELKKVTDETDESYAKFIKTMSGVGAEIGATVTNLTNMAASWARLGYSMEQAGNLAKSTAVLLNVSEFTDADSASEALISTIQAYGYAAEESMSVVDVLNEVNFTCLLVW